MQKRKDTGWWYPYIFIGLFGIVVAVNGTLFYFANSTFTGLSTEGAYDRGLKYNAVLAQEEAQRKLGWQMDVKAVPAAAQAKPEGRTAELVLTWRDRDGKAIEGLDIKATLLRPTVAGHDLDVPLQPLGSGKYGATVQLDFPGQWDIRVEARQDGETRFKTKQRILVP